MNNKFENTTTKQKPDMKIGESMSMDMIMAMSKPLHMGVLNPVLSWFNHCTGFSRQMCVYQKHFGKVITLPVSKLFSGECGCSYLTLYPWWQSGRKINSQSTEIFNSYNQLSLSFNSLFRQVISDFIYSKNIYQISSDKNTVSDNSNKRSRSVLSPPSPGGHDLTASHKDPTAISKLSGKTQIGEVFKAWANVNTAQQKHNNITMPSTEQIKYAMDSSRYLSVINLPKENLESTADKNVHMHSINHEKYNKQTIHSVTELLSSINKLEITQLKKQLKHTSSEYQMSEQKILQQELQHSVNTVIEKVSNLQSENKVEIRELRQAVVSLGENIVRQYQATRKPGIIPLSFAGRL